MNSLKPEVQNKAEVIYHKVSPDGNVTALVEVDNLRNRYAELARRIIFDDLDVEQVGFIEEPGEGEKVDFNLHMMGGEFCGNAIRSAAFLKKKNSRVLVGLPEVGNEFEVQTTSKSAKITVPAKIILGVEEIPEGYVVNMEGITHIVVIDRPSKALTEKLIRRYEDHLPAIGIIYTKTDKSGSLVINPLIWVRGTDTLINETGCASGSIAVAVVNYMEKGSRRVSIVQPSNKKYKVRVKTQKGVLKSVTLDSKVKYMGQKVIEI